MDTKDTKTTSDAEKDLSSEKKVHIYTVGNSPTAPPFFIYPFPLFLPCGGSRGSEALR